MRRNSIRTVTGVVVCIMIGACASTTTPGVSTAPSVDSVAATASPSKAPTASPTITSPSLSPSPSPSPAPAGPFTILLLGADQDGRTDAVMVVGVDPVAGRVTYASIPRDTVNLPLPNGETFKGRKVNELYNYAATHAKAFPQGPGRATADAIGLLLGIKVDYYARTNFPGFVALVNSVGKVPITLPESVSDDFLQVGPNTFGITFPKGKQSLDGKKALIYVRIRHSDTDFARQRRQQSFVTAAGLFLLQKPELAAPLIAAAAKNLKTDFPIDRVTEYQAAMKGLDAGAIEGVVLGARSYEDKVSCSCGYALAPKLGAMRAKAAKLFPWAVDG